ncbi:MAG: hypothetical protein ACREDH_12145 [Methylocella sp.]
MTKSKALTTRQGKQILRDLLKGRGLDNLLTDLESVAYEESD